jgi:hypothetical protein
VQVVEVVSVAIIDQQTQEQVVLLELYGEPVALSHQLIQQMFNIF